ncbi:MAG: PDZ domain-containing protein, partial [Spongiibacter sp.]
VVAEVQPGSAAEKAGLKAGDVVIEAAGKAVISSAQLRTAIGLRRAGDKVTLKVLRDGKTLSLKAVLGEVETSVSADAGIHPLLEGVALSDDEGGVKVTQVKADAPAADKLRAGDLIVSVNQRRVQNVAEFRKYASQSENGMLLRVIRGRYATWVVLKG